MTEEATRLAELEREVRGLRRAKEILKTSTAFSPQRSLTARPGRGPYCGAGRLHDAHRDRFEVEPICTVLKDACVQIAPSTYYATKAKPPSARAICDAELIADIKVAHKASLGVYGARTIHAELNREGITVARCTIERLVRAEGLRGILRDTTSRPARPPSAVG